MISKSTVKLINSLSIKKYRQKEKLFLVEGDKSVLEVLKSRYITRKLFANETFLENFRENADAAGEVIPVSSSEIKKVSLQQHPQNCIALCEIPSEGNIIFNLTDVALYLDGIQDPGNLGTIIRTCDWFGIDTVFCSTDTADFYNPKVIQATMGSFCRVSCVYTEMEPLAEKLSKFAIPLLGTFPEGSNIFSNHFPKAALFVLGNEGKGIRKETEKFITQKISIPRMIQKFSGAESLNVAVAAGIICAEFRRQHA